MRKFIIYLFILYFSCVNAYSFWIWSPRTNKFSGPDSASLATPYLQFRRALGHYDQKKFTAAYIEFSKIIVDYPDSRQAAKSQFYMGKCKEALDKPFEAFLDYQKLINSYPNSRKINETLKNIYDIGEYFLQRESKKWLGLSVYDFVEHPSVEIFTYITDKAPYSEFAALAQYKIGMLYSQLGRPEEARDAFRKVIDNYPTSEWVQPSKYQVAIAASKISAGEDYDSSYIEEASETLDEFVKQHPETAVFSKAKGQLKNLKNKEARKNYDIAYFYETQRKYQSALYYYNIVVDKYPNSEYFDRASRKIELLEANASDVKEESPGVIKNGKSSAEDKKEHRKLAELKKKRKKKLKELKLKARQERQKVSTSRQPSSGISQEGQPADKDIKAEPKVSPDEASGEKEPEN
ncbi:MAG: tetratricopeptide repeat protein [Candidatus Omnitrophota bacterium]